MVLPPKVIDPEDNGVRHIVTSTLSKQAEAYAQRA